jgi:PPOX class probable F420-dependent enzyme
VAESVFPDPDSAFGRRVRRRLNEEIVIWLTTVGADGTPQPNPVWFLSQGESILVYNRPDARRLTHVRRRPRVALNLDTHGRGGDIIVFTGTAEVADGEAPPHEQPDYVAKYRDHMMRVSGSLEGFSRRYPVPLRVRVQRVRGL